MQQFCLPITKLGESTQMGFEYRIAFQRETEAQLDTLLRELVEFTDYDSKYGSYNYRLMPGKGMPAIEARIEGTGVYVCVYAQTGLRIFQVLFASLLSEYNEVTVSKLGWE